MNSAILIAFVAGFVCIGGFAMLLSSGLLTFGAYRGSHKKQHMLITGVTLASIVVLTYGAHNMLGLAQLQNEAFVISERAAASQNQWATWIEKSAARTVKAPTDRIEKALRSSDSKFVEATVTSAVNELVAIGPAERATNLKIVINSGIEAQKVWRDAYKFNQAKYHDLVESSIGASLLVKSGLFAARMPDWDESSPLCDQRLWDCISQRLHARPAPAGALVASKL